MSLASLPNSLPFALAASSLPFAFHCAPMGISFLVCVTPQAAQNDVE
jgi:hypothetical protein